MQVFPLIQKQSPRLLTSLTTIYARLLRCILNCAVLLLLRLAGKEVEKIKPTRKVFFMRK